MTGTIHLRIDDHIAHLTIDNPAIHNALSLTMLDQLGEHTSTLAQTADLRAVIIAGAGDRAFCSGGDLRELRQQRSSDFGAEMSQRTTLTLSRLSMLPCPVVAAINGYALGGGSEIALACDMRIGDATMQMGFVQVRMGLTPGWGAGQRLMQIVGYSRAFEMLASGRRISADEALSLGLILRTAPAGTAVEAAVGLIDTLQTQQIQTMVGIKRILHANLTHPPRNAAHIEQDVFPGLWASDAHWQAVDAFFSRNSDSSQTPEADPA